MAERAPSDALASRAVPPRCPYCCDHGIPRDGSRWCGWCEDVNEGYGDAMIAEDAPMWLCPHGVGESV